MAAQRRNGVNKKIFRTLFSILLITLGVFAIIAGEADDSPGLQGMGLILIISGFNQQYRGRKAK
jgi:hypothetical protein